MNIIGIVAEYNPFHNGHLYHINKIKEMYPDSTIIVVMSSSFTQRGLPSIINKWDKTEIALQYGIDLVIELPFEFSTQSADIFAYGAIKILNKLKVDTLVFGSESDDIEKLKRLANLQLNNEKYQTLVKKYIDEGINYPTAMNNALKDLGGDIVKDSNDLLALSYIKEIIRQKTNINPVSIKRSNSYLDSTLNESVSSATAIREAVKKNLDISKNVPIEVNNILKKDNVYLDDYFNLLKYKIYSSKDLSIYLDVDEGIENRLLKYIGESKTIDELTEKIKSKRYTYNKINRMYIHILCSYTKEDNKNLDINYIRVLGFNKKGQQYLNKIKKYIDVPLLTRYKPILNREMEITHIYTMVLPYEIQKKLIEMETKTIIIK